MGGTPVLCRDPDDQVLPECQGRAVHCIQGLALPCRTATSPLSCWDRLAASILVKALLPLSLLVRPAVVDKALARPCEPASAGLGNRRAEQRQPDK